MITYSPLCSMPARLTTRSKLAVRFTDTECYFVTEASVYRLL
jgi:hypothetical protein